MLHRQFTFGHAQSAWLAFLGSVLLLGLLVGLLVWDPDKWFAQRGEPVFVYCAAAMKEPMEIIAREYERETGVPVHVQFGGSQSLLPGIEVSKRGDLYLPADDSYLEIARGKKLLDETIPMARMNLVLAVRKGNPKGIHSLYDLLHKELKIAQANPDATAVGNLTRATLQKIGRWEKLKQRTLVLQPTVIDVATDIKIGAVDAGIVWDATLQQFPELEAVPIAEFNGVQAHVSVGLLRTSAQPMAALRFARYLSARDRGLEVFAQHGFVPIEGDQWSAEPALNLYVGAMLRPAIEDTIDLFEKREGVRVERTYNGCGILVAQMKAGARPDAYFACDQSFMNDVKHLFLDADDVSTNQLVILVPKGNPHRIRSMVDLGKPGLSIGVGNEKQCALGVLTQKTLRAAGRQESVMKNVTVRAATGDTLVNQMRTGALDAVVAYVSNAVEAADELEAIKIDIPCAVAVQPIAVGKDSSHKYLTQRLVNAIRSRESQELFELSGFRWKGATP